MSMDIGTVTPRTVWRPASAAAGMAAAACMPDSHGIARYSARRDPAAAPARQNRARRSALKVDGTTPYNPLKLLRHTLNLRIRIILFLNLS
eukprot:6203941-Pleurochrysis_carterae.AAC.1